VIRHDDDGRTALEARAGRDLDGAAAGGRACPPETAAEAIERAHLDAGADHVVVQPLGADGAFDVAQLSELAVEVDDLLKR
jgi:hypothetical protein